jgi:poly-gamma-glutamate synthesis protein (capsule biosynthesis protein)
MAERVNGPIPKPVDFTYIWGDALEDLSQFAPEARIVNLETSVTTSGQFEPKGINYRMHPANVACLTAAKIDCCALANNHVLDFGRSGLLETMETLRRAGIKTAGAGHNLAQAMEPAVIVTSGSSRALVFGAATPHSGIENSWAATSERAGIMLLQDLTDEAADELAKRARTVKKQGDVVIVSIHWGGNWGYRIQRQQQRFGHRLIDSGAVDAIHGHSSHHPKGIEVYKNKLIVYGCGDFINDYEGISGYEGFRSNLALAYFAKLDPETGNLVQLEMPPFELKRLRLIRARAEDRRWLCKMLTREGAELGTEAHEEKDRLVLDWR